MTVPMSHLQMLNRLPSNKAAAEVLRRMEVSPSNRQLAMLQLAWEKGAEAMSPAEDPMLDLADLDRLLTASAARRISMQMSDDPDWLEEQSAEELIMAIMSEVPLDLFSPRMLQ